MDFDISTVRITQGEKLDLNERPTKLDRLYLDDFAYKAQLKANVRRLSDVQERFYADSRHALLIIFQAMDTAGKDGCIEHVLSGVNPQGCEVHSFRHPSANELEHDFLWRTTQALPSKGMIGVFNRSYYEEVLVVRVHPEILAAQQVEGSGERASFWRHRFESINEHEQHLHRNGTRIIKFFLHLSKKEQKKRLLSRLDDPNKRWKFSPNDLVERGLWDSYMHAYAEALKATSTADSPWYCIPADDKKNARLMVSEVILKTLEGLKPEFPEVSPEREQEFAEARAQLTKASSERPPPPASTPSATQSS
jgi:PPK2 family polyphosphate:nucleotide phosphotransferase